METKFLILFLIMLICIVLFILFFRSIQIQQEQISSSKDYMELCGSWKRMKPPCTDEGRKNIDLWFLNESKNLTKICLDMFPAKIIEDSLLACEDSCKNNCELISTVDLAIGDVIYWPHSMNKIEINFENIGSASVKNVNYRVWNYKENVISSGKINIIKSFDKNVTILYFNIAGQSKDERKIKIFIDPDNAISEKNEINNCIIYDCSGSEVTGADISNILCSRSSCE